MRITNRKLKEFLWNAENKNACKESIDEIISCKTIKGIIQHENVIQWTLWYTKKINKEDFDLIEYVFKYRRKLDCVNEEDMRSLVNFVSNHRNHTERLEKLILDSKYPYFGIYYVDRLLKKRWLEFENRIEKLDSIYESDLQHLFIYVWHFRQKPWKKLEKLILEIENGWFAYLYSRYLLKRPWKEAECFIKRDTESAFLYSKFVLECPWKEGEEAIRQDIDYQAYYEEWCQDF